MNYTTNYDYSEDLLADNSSLLSIYDDVLCNHTVGDYTDINRYDEEEDDDLVSFDDASDGSVRILGEINPNVKVLNLYQTPNVSGWENVPVEKPNPRRWETVKPVKATNGLSTLVKLNNKSDDINDGLSIGGRSDILSVSDYPPPKDITFEWTGKSFGGLSSRMQMPQIFPSYKDILTSQYFLV